MENNKYTEELTPEEQSLYEDLLFYINNEMIVFSSQAEELINKIDNLVECVKGKNNE